MMLLYGDEWVIVNGVGIEYSNQGLVLQIDDKQIFVPHYVIRNLTKLSNIYVQCEIKKWFAIKFRLSIKPVEC
jgi:hypothetical protein